MWLSFYGLMSGKDGESTDKTEKRYELIWKTIQPCIKQCLLDNYKNVPEMLCGRNWIDVLWACKCIITKHTKELRSTDPHEFDRAICWKVVSGGWTDPKWRCICAFFLVAAMELEIVKKEDERFAKVKAERSDLENHPGVGKDHPHWSIFDLIRRVDEKHSENFEEVKDKHNAFVKLTRDNINDLHRKSGGGNGGNGGNGMSGASGVGDVQQVVHVNFHHGIPPASNYPPLDPHSSYNLDEIMKKVMEIIKAGGVGPPKYAAPNESTKGNVWDREPLGMRCDYF